MYFKFSLILSFAAFALPNVLVGKADTTYTSLNTGDKVPLFENVLVHNRSGVLEIPSRQSRLTIIDFWNVWCTSCIQSIPKMEALQQEFGERIQVILVTTDSKEQVNLTCGKIQNCKKYHFADSYR